MTRQVCECNRCGYCWIQTTEEEPKRCARCKSPLWNRERLRPGRPPKNTSTVIDKPKPTASRFSHLPALDEVRTAKPKPKRRR